MPSGLVKATWGLRDYPEMTWRGCTIHAIDFGRYEDNRVRILDDGTVDTEFDDLDDTAHWHFMTLDVDYIVGRSEPEAPGWASKFWIAPATLSFSAPEGIEVMISDGPSDLVPVAPGMTTIALVISDLQRIKSKHEYDSDPQWRITGEGFAMSVWSGNFWLNIRAEPRLVERPSLDLVERGGVSFGQIPFDYRSS